MTIDPYSPCPGGTGKKIKFCCSDLVHELDKLQRMIDGDQRVAGLDYVTKLDAKYPGRACLLSARATLEAMLGNREQSEATLATFREKHPENPIALAELAVLQATGEKPTDAIGSLQRALELCGNELPQPLYDAFEAVAKSLAEAGHVVPALSLLWFQVNLSRGEDKQVLQLWASLDGDPGVPLLLKNQFELVPAPAGAPWRYEFDIALQRAMQGQWQIAADKFSALAPIAGQSPELWRNLATSADLLPTMPARSKHCVNSRPLICRSTMPSRPKPRLCSMKHRVGCTPPRSRRRARATNSLLRSPWPTRRRSKSDLPRVGSWTVLRSILACGARPPARSALINRRPGPVTRFWIDRCQRPMA